MATLRTKDARFEMRASQAQMDVLNRAIATCGSSKAEFVLSAALERANQVLDQHNKITLKDAEFDRFIESCNEAKEPNQALKDALKFTKESGFV